MPSGEVTTFYDASTIGSVSRTDATQLINYARGTFSWISDDTLVDPLPYNVPTDTTTLDPRLLAISSSRSLILTKHSLIASTEKRVAGLCLPLSPTGFRAAVHIPTHLTEASLDEVLLAVTHELAHGYGIGHCATKSCVMFPRHTNEPFNVMKPFCGVHILKLKR